MNDDVNLTNDQVNLLLERFDKTETRLQRRIVARLMLDLHYAKGEIEALQGADATLRAIERIIPRNDAHRDYVETVELALEARGRA